MSALWIANEGGDKQGPRRGSRAGVLMSPHSKMKTRFVVIHAKGPSWDPTKLRREQSGWDAHAQFMDKLTAERFVVLGGPLGEGDGDDAMLVIDAPDEETAIARLADDPWKKSGMLVVESIQRWTIFLEAEGNEESAKRQKVQNRDR